MDEDDNPIALSFPVSQQILLGTTRNPWQYQLPMICMCVWACPRLFLQDSDCMNHSIPTLSVSSKTTWNFPPPLSFSRLEGGNPRPGCIIPPVSQSVETRVLVYTAHLTGRLMSCHA